MKSRLIPAGILAVLWSTMLLSSCSKDNNSNNGYGGGNNNPGTSGNTVSIASMAFAPGTLTVKTGTTVTWTNNDNVSHTVTADNGSFASSILKKGETYSHQFSSAGTYPYHCEIHPSMKASVVVN